MKTENPYFNETASDFLPLFNASPLLWKIFTQNGFKAQVGFSHLNQSFDYEPGKMTHLRKNGECIVVFLKDGRVHVMNGPLSRWHLFDKLNIATLRCILAFASMSDIDQFAFRNYMKDRCTNFSDIFHHLPGNNVGWKHRFLNQYSSFPAVDLYAYAR
ncbi:MAG: hypothetical protein ACKO8Q_04410 [Bacteroidota bacterium]|jgi:hypothetical protein